MNYREYLDLIIDDGTSERLFSSLKSSDFLEFSASRGYNEQLKDAYNKSGNTDSIEIYSGKIKSNPVILGIMNFEFIGGSMGSVVGEALSRAIVKSRDEKKPLIIVCKSGGARMQEGAISLMQLAKISSQLAKFSNDGGLYISILTDPTTGGVTASYGMLGDIILAEPGALIGFAGPRVIKQTIGQDLPEGFQRSEFLLEKGFIDQIVTRNEMKDRLHQIIDILN
jgi:acetyl-CoA carboxylase carboxyl transferase subunit beta